jgi:YVTN family beta-propeller protein
LVPAAAILLLALAVPSAEARNAYVANFGSESVSVINTATNTASPTTIKVGLRPFAIAITPDGKTAYVANRGSETVSAIDTATNTASPTTIKVGLDPEAIAITPDGKTAYVTNDGSESVSVINTATNQASPTTIKVGVEPAGIAITPDGKTAYVTNLGSESVSVINTATNMASPTAIKVGKFPEGIAITPDGKTAYVANEFSESVSVIDTATNTALPTTIKVGANPTGIAISPDQSPLASIHSQATRARPGVPVSLDASASKDPDGSIAAFSWNFGDNQSASLTTATTTHTYATPGTYNPTLAATDNEGCSASPIFTGQTASCAGSPPATATINVVYPGVNVSCPKSAKPKGCSFRLQAIGSKPKKGKKAKPESALAKAKVKAGRTAIVSLKPTKAFAAKLAVASNVLVKETVSAHGSAKTRLAKLKVVQ